MELIRHKDLRSAISVNLTVLKPYVKKETGLAGACREEVLDAIMRALTGCVIVRPDLVGFNASQKLGRFGITEPHPFPELAEPIDPDWIAPNAGGAI